MVKSGSQRKGGLNETEGEVRISQEQTEWSARQRELCLPTKGSDECMVQFGTFSVAGA